jgi:hypothetical protein
MADELLKAFNANRPAGAPSPGEKAAPGGAPPAGPGSNLDDVKKGLLGGHPGGFKRGGVIISRDGFPPCVIIISETTQRLPDAASHLAAENIMLATKSLGLDSFWMGAFGADVMQAKLAKDECPQIIKQLIPEDHHFVCALGIGYADWNAFRAPRVARRTDNVFFFE